MISQIGYKPASQSFEGSNNLEFSEIHIISGQKSSNTNPKSYIAIFRKYYIAIFRLHNIVKMKIRPEELTEKGYDLLDKFGHKELLPFKQTYIKKRTKYSIFYYLSNLLVF